MNAEHLLEQLNSLIEEKVKIEYDYIAFSKRNEDVKDEIKRIENFTLTEITNELDSNGKPIFSNETKRQVEMQIRLKERNDYHTLKKEYEKNSDILSELRIKIDKNKFKAYEIISRLGGGN